MLIDGATRDLVALGRRRFPFLCRGSSPIRSSGRLHTAAVNAEVVVGVTVRPGDLIAIDCDGFVCVPSEHAQAVLVEASNVMRREKQRDQNLKRKRRKLVRDVPQTGSGGGKPVVPDAARCPGW